MFTFSNYPTSPGTWNTQLTQDGCNSKVGLCPLSSWFLKLIWISYSLSVWRFSCSSMIVYVSPIMLIIECKMVIMFWACHPCILNTCLLVSNLGTPSNHTRLDYRCPPSWAYESNLENTQEMIDLKSHIHHGTKTGLSNMNQKPHTINPSNAM